MDDSTLPVFEIVMGLLGGLALFLFGMEQMTDGLKAVAGDGMRKLLATLTRNRVAGALTGAVVTAVIQSSSVTTVLVVGFVSAGLMSLTQCVGIIMGANVGTTITAQIVAFKVTKYALALVFVGFALVFAGKKERLRQWGAMVMGLGLIFFGMGLMSDATSPLREYQPFIDLMGRMENPVLGILVAAAFTALVQSSSATTGIVIVLATQGFITLEAGIALAFGSNVGTCVTALLATLGKPRIAMRAAAIHVVFNVAGVLVFLPFIDQLAAIVRDISPHAADLEGMERLAAETPRQIANAHTCFNVVATVVFLPAATLIARLATMLVPERPEVIPPRAQPRYLEDAFLETPALAVDPVRKELCRLGRHVTEFADAVVLAARSGTGLDEAGVEHRNIGLLFDAIVQYLRRLQAGEVDESLAARLRALGAVATNIEHVSDIFATNLVQIARTAKAEQLALTPETRAAVEPLHEMVRAAFADALRALDESSVEVARSVIARKPEVQAAADACLAELALRIDPGDARSLSAFRVQAQIVELVRRYYYFAKKIAKEVCTEVEERRSEDADVMETLGG